jgi:hypothetical protein
MKYGIYNDNILGHFMLKNQKWMFISPGTYVQLTELQHTLKKEISCTFIPCTGALCDTL